MIVEYLRDRIKLMIPVLLAASLFGCGGSSHLPIPSTSRPEFLYEAENNQILSFIVNPSTGALSIPIAIAGPDTLFGASMAADPGGKFLFAYDRQGPAIDVFSINPTDGALTMANGSPFSVGNLGLSGVLVTDTTGGFLYDAGFFGIAGFSVNNVTGGLTSIAGSPFPGTVAPFGIVADPAGKFLYTPNLIGNPQATISAFAIDSSNGALTTVPGSPFPTQTDGFSFSIAVHPSGKFLYADVGPESNAVEGWTIDGTTGALTTVVPGSPFPVGNTPGPFISSIVIDPSGKFLYAPGMPGTIYGFTINQNSGALTPMTGSPFLIFAGRPLIIDPSGQFMYSPFLESIYGIKIDASTGKLTPISGSPFSTGIPATFPSALTIVRIP
jgi:6-phosphogluconolactonase (cycloisomerase 2 family)